MNFFGAGIAAPSSDALRFSGPPGVPGGICPLPGIVGTPIPSGSVSGSNLKWKHSIIVYSITGTKIKSS